MIQHLRHSEIDKDTWDTLHISCADRIWYMQSWVLDRCCPEWECLIDKDRGAIMPLLWRRKFGIDYLYQPYAVQQQGVFAKEPSDALSRSFFEAVPKRFRYWDIHLNGTISASGLVDGTVEENTNQTLLLSGTAEELRAGYSQGHRRNLRKAGAAAPDIVSDLRADEFVALFRRTTAARFGGIPDGGLELLGVLLEEGLRRGQCTILAMREEGTPIAAVCFMEWEGRSILLKSANDERGLEHQAMFHLLDHYITSKAGSGLLLDFAGSNTPSVARFNAGSGARSSVYLHLTRNRLPLPLRWFKR
jgi:hypothetical protein